METRVSKYCLLFQEFQAHEGGIWSLACKRLNGTNTANVGSYLSKQAEVIVTGGLDGLIKIWELHNDGLKERSILEGHGLGVVSVNFNKDGTLIASTGMDASLRIWNVAKGSCVSKMDIAPSDTSNVTFSHDDRYVVTGSHHGKLRMYNVKTKLQERQLVNPRERFLLAVAVSPDGKHVASGDEDGFIYIHEYVTGNLVQKMAKHAKPIRCLIFSPDSKLLLTCSDDNQMNFTDMVSGNTTSICGHSSWVLSAAFSNDGRFYASASADKCVKIWDFATHRCLHTFSDHLDKVWGVGFNSECNRVVSVGEDGSVIVSGIPTYF
ncbi:SKI8 subunit of superkiller complex protein-like [Macrosteles quadrilineatus]|uniref:SKI8 subunit of superkiller complex protein-like n=1 Tax=Macrosteles quadrilineatus TaxID=74068 RepID=UPI0023E158B9|nr:SKI8 subunit of superkiller complex protein-like [Macrosteles quadrilineatus]